ncbi:MAG: ABC transporter ATP-binding protein [Bacteroidota bacterium]
MTVLAASLRHLWARVAQPRRVLAVAAVGAVVQSLLVVTVPVVVQYLFAEVLPQRDPTSVLLWGGVILALYVGQAGVAVWDRLTLVDWFKRDVAALREALLDRIHRLPRARVHAEDRGHLHSTLVHDTERVDVMANAALAEVLPAALSSALLVTVLLTIDVALFGVLVLLMGPASLALRLWLRPRLVRDIDAFHGAVERYHRAAYRALEVLDLTHLQTARTEEAALQGAEVERHRVAAQRRVATGVIYTSIQQTLLAASAVLILVIGGAFVAEAALSTGDLVAFYVAVMMLRASVNVLVTRYPLVIEGFAASRRLDALLTDPEAPPYTGRQPAPTAGAYVFEKVAFGYGAEPLFEDVDLAVAPGQTVAITGANGSGKTSLLYLLLGFYRPTAGRLVVGGTPYDAIDMESLLRGFGVVMQDAMLFAGTIRENLTYGSAGATEAEVVEAARLANAHDFVASFPEGYETPVGEGGTFLSGGQRQRLALARALLRRPRVLVLDEPTNHLDQDAVDALLERIRALPGSPALVLISHDPHVIEQADTVYRLDDRRVWELQTA